jgi:N-carbamoylputrescine amidase
VDPRGQIIDGSASDTEEELVVRDLDLDVIEEVRQQWAFYRDRRPDAYGDLVAP